MTNAVCSVSPIIYLYRIGALEWLPKLFDEIWMPSVVLEDLLEGRFIGYNVPSPFDLTWIDYRDPELTIPSAWMALDLSSGEVAAMAVAFEHSRCTVLLDDPLARKAARAVGLESWGTLKILLESKARGFTDRIAPYVDQMGNTGIFMLPETRRRILKLANEADPEPPSDSAPLGSRPQVEAPAPTHQKPAG
jgi:predicted nucleic acid-binding protein